MDRRADVLAEPTIRVRGLVDSVEGRDRRVLRLLGGQDVVHVARTDEVAGILNGVDYRDWDPRHDPYLTAHFGPQDLRGKQTNKELLIAATHLDMAVTRPLIGMVTRLAEQKGIDLLFDALPSLLQERDFGFLVLGSGDERYAAFFEALARRFPGRAAFRSGYDESLAHLIEAGSAPARRTNARSCADSWLKLPSIIP